METHKGISSEQRVGLALPRKPSLCEETYVYSENFSDAALINNSVQAFHALRLTLGWYCNRVKQRSNSKILHIPHLAVSMHLL
jgi:hypothetical protein